MDIPREPKKALRKGSPTPGSPFGASPWPVRTRAAPQEASGGRVREAASAFAAAPGAGTAASAPPGTVGR